MTAARYALEKGSRVGPGERFEVLTDGVDQAPHFHVARVRERSVESEYTVIVDVSEDPESSEAWRHRWAPLVDVHHSNLVPIVEHGDVQGRTAIYIQQNSTAVPLDRYASLLDIRDVMEIGDRVLRALAVLHSLGVHHGNLHVRHVLLARDRGALEVVLSGHWLPWGSSAVAPNHTVPIPDEDGWLDSEQEEESVRADMVEFGFMMFQLATGVKATTSLGVTRAYGESCEDAEAAIDVRGAIPQALSDLIQGLMRGDPGMTPSAATFAGRWQASGPDEMSGAARNLASPGGQIPHLCFGRDEELERLHALLDDERVRLLTVFGPPGIGKSCLVAEYLRSGSSPGKRDPARTVDLHGISGSEAIGAAVVAALGLTPKRELPAVEKLLASHGPLTLILDGFGTREDPNCILNWLSNAPELRVLLTSRGRIRVAGEQEIQLGPLPRRAAAMLLVSRVRALNRSFLYGAEQRTPVRNLVDALQRIPLAIVLTAPTVAMSDLAYALDRVSQPSRLDLHEPSEAGGRHDSFRWLASDAVDSLEPEEAFAAVQLAVFEGTFEISAVEQVLVVEDEFGGYADVLDVIDDLEAAGVVFCHPRTMIRSVLPWVRERLLGADLDARQARILADARGRHARYVANVGCSRHTAAADLLRLAADLESGCRWAAEMGDADVAIGCLEGLARTADRVNQKLVVGLAAEVLHDGENLPAPSRRRLLSVTLAAAARCGYCEVATRLTSLLGELEIDAS